MSEEKITYKLERLETGGFMAYCPDMKPVAVQGITEEETTKKLISVAKMYVKRHPEAEKFLQNLEAEIKINELEL